MDFLKSAVASAISKGPAFPYSFDERIDLEQSIWTLHNGTKREDSSKCSVFSFDVAVNKSRLPLARNALRKLRTLRHPGLIKVFDTVETDSYIYIATERLTPLSWHIKRKSLAEGTIKWGLHSIAKALKFINEDAASIHGCVRSSSVFTSESGEWKLAGFEALSSIKEDDAILYTYGSLMPDSGRYSPPEVLKTGWDAVKRGPLSATDAYGYGILTYEVFNGIFTSTDQLSQPKGISPSMQQSYKRLINANPKARISVAQFLEQGQRSGGFFEIPLIHLSEGIENLGLKTETEKDEFLSRLEEVSDDFPEDFFKMKVLPELLKSVEFGGGGPRVLSLILKIGTKLSEDEYEQRLTPVIVRLFANQDRALRVCLLDGLPLMIDHLSQKIVNNGIFPQMVTGFSDVAPVVREQTVKAVLVVVPKLSDRTINGELLRHLAKTANDEQPGIRTNTTICLGKIARNLGTGSRSKVLTAAFLRSLRDPFVHARNAALLALAATLDVFSDEECATKILPGLCPSLVDKERLVRDQANKTLDLYLQRVRKYSQALPDTAQAPSGVPGHVANAPRMGTPQQDTSWAGWAISSFTNKVASASGQMQAPSDASPALTSEARSSSVPPSVESSKAIPPTPQSRGLQLPSRPVPHALSNPVSSVSSPQLVEDELDTAWGDGEAAWGEETDPFTAPTSQNTSVTSNPFEDKGEPDFAGWLDAQAKSKVKTFLPKGLTKSVAAKPTLKPKANSTNPVGSKKSATVTSKPRAAPAKQVTKLEKKKEDDEEDAAWGDDW
ncbi:ARM repeat-containing protein [Trichodelitschia bisporula]|uniref:ARM repeat-containing protein n=1 Tax=Trichodelitschia bisporula TaxID=703511 RepID=A0A6G1HSX1_9PEZI|nr:ARM repeat-containing protein [Trichodelitschia bisporula]